jgi:hypothetical protein
VSAILSECGVYRYELRRVLSDTPEKPGTVLWVLTNPSKADAKKDDPTVRKCRGFTRAWGYGQFLIVNAYAFRATNPKALLSAEDPFGPDNLATLSAALRLHGDGLVVLGWGDALPKPLRAETSARILGMTAANGVTPMCLGTTQNGQPRHPLMLAYTTPLEPWSGP